MATFDAGQFARIEQRARIAQPWQPVDLFDQLMELTDGGKNITLSVQINGIEVGTKELFERIEENMERAVAEEASRLISALPALDAMRENMERINEVLEQAESSVRQQLSAALESAGIKVWSDYLDG